MGLGRLLHLPFGERCEWSSYLESFFILFIVLVFFASSMCICTNKRNISRENELRIYPDQIWLIVPAIHSASLPAYKIPHSRGFLLKKITYEHEYIQQTTPTKAHRKHIMVNKQSLGNDLMRNAIAWKKGRAKIESTFYLISKSILLRQGLTYYIVIW